MRALVPPPPAPSIWIRICHQQLALLARCLEPAVWAGRDVPDWVVAVGDRIDKSDMGGHVRGRGLERLRVDQDGGAYR